MQNHWVMSVALAVTMAAGCSTGNDLLPARGPDMFPLNDDAIWLFEGVAGADGVQVALRVASGETATSPKKLQIGWQEPGAREAAVMEFTARWRDGFLVLQDGTQHLRLIPERPKLQLTDWTWKNGAEPYRARILDHEGFVAAPKGRWRDVLVVEVGPADGTPDQWRWHFARGEGPVRIEVGEGEALQVLELAKTSGPRDLPSMTMTKSNAKPAAKSKSQPKPSKKTATK